MSEVSVVRQEPLQLNRFTTETVERNGITFINRPEGVVASWEPPPGFNPQAHAQQHNLSNIGYETHIDSITGETRSIAYTEMTHEEYEELRQSPKARTLELPPMVPEKVGNNFGQITFKPAVNPVRAELANPPEIPPKDLENPEAPEGERTSKKLDDLKAQREANNKNLINTDTADEYVRFDELHGSLNELISEIKGEPGTIGDYLAQRDRAAVGFTKDALLGIGELAYEGSKLIFDAQQAMLTPAGIQGKILDAKIYLEEIRLGNVTPSTMGSGAISTATNVGKAMVSPITKPWAEGQYVEAVTRGLLEAITLPLVALKSGKIAKSGNALKDGTSANKTANTTGDANKTTTAKDAVKTSKSTGPNGDGGKVEKKTKKRESQEQEKTDDINKKIPEDEYLAIKKRSVHNVESTTLVLGKYKPTVSNGVEDWSIPGSDSYVAIARIEKATYFDLGSEWGSITSKYKLSDNEMFDAFNIPVLDNAVSAGKQIKFTHDPRVGGGFLKKEWEYLQNTHGFKRLKESNGVWYAK